MKCIKDFLKPNWWKIVFGLVFWFLLPNIIDDFPLPCFKMAGGCVGGSCFDRMKTNQLFCAFNFFFYIIVAYILACLIYFIIAKIKRLMAKPKKI